MMVKYTNAGVVLVFTLRVHKYNILNVFMTRYNTLEGVIGISVHIELQCSAILQFRSHSSIRGPHIALAECFKVSLYIL